MIFKKTLVNDILEGRIDDKELDIVLKTLKRDICRFFGNTIPKTFFIFPKSINVYCLSHTLCIEVPSSGEKPYLRLLQELREYLEENFIIDVEYFDSRITYIVKKNKNRNLYI